MPRDCRTSDLFNRRRLYTVWFALHFALVLLVSARQSLSVLILDRIFSKAWEPLLNQVETVITSALGENPVPSHPWGLLVNGYANWTGTETGFGFFAPRVAVVHKLVFEIQYPDGRVEYELPHVGNNATGLRLFLLLDNIARIDYSLLRETMLKMMAFGVWQEHRNATVIRAVFGIMHVPSLADFEQGQQETYQVLYAYEFRFSASSTESKH